MNLYYLKSKKNTRYGEIIGEDRTGPRENYRQN